MVPDEPWFDPEKPARWEQLVNDLVPEEEQAGRAGSWKGILLPVILLGAIGLAAAWRWTPLKEYLNLQTLSAWADLFQQHTWTPLLVVGAYLVGGVILVPVTLLILVTALVFGPWVGFSYSLGGCLLSALLTFAIGHGVGREAVRRVAGGELNRVSRRLTDRGLLAVVAVRVLPIAPFTIVNLIAGASGIRLRDFALGTVVGMTPGIVAITLFEGSLRQMVESPEVENILFLLAAVLMGILAGGLGSAPLARCQRGGGRKQRIGGWLSAKRKRSPPGFSGWCPTTSIRGWGETERGTSTVPPESSAPWLPMSSVCRKWTTGTVLLE